MKTLGDDIRLAVSQIGYLRSVLPKAVGVHALSATATTETYYRISLIRMRTLNRTRP